MGPCALEYTKLKTADHYWTDPSADELVQRHRIRGPPNRQDSPAKRPALGVGIPLPTPHTYPGYAHEPVWKGSLASIFFADAIWALEMHQGSGYLRRAFYPHWHLTYKCQEHTNGPWLERRGRPRADPGQSGPLGQLEGLCGILTFPEADSQGWGLSHAFLHRFGSGTQVAMHQRTG